jgi:hypothetical protein
MLLICNQNPNKRWQWNIFLDGCFVGYIDKHQTHISDTTRLYSEYTVFGLTSTHRDNSIILSSTTMNTLKDAKDWVRKNLSTRADFLKAIALAQYEQVEELFLQPIRT